MCVCVSTQLSTLLNKSTLRKTNEIHEQHHHKLQPIPQWFKALKPKLLLYMKSLYNNILTPINNVTSRCQKSSEKVINEAVGHMSRRVALWLVPGRCIEWWDKWVWRRCLCNLEMCICYFGVQTTAVIRQQNNQQIINTWSSWTVAAHNRHMAHLFVLCGWYGHGQHLWFQNLFSFVIIRDLKDPVPI